MVCLLVFQKTIMSFLKTNTLTEAQNIDFLKTFTKKIIPRLENPLLFADYLMVNAEHLKTRITFSHRDFSNKKETLTYKY